MVWTLLSCRLRFFWNSLWRVNWGYRLLGFLALFGVAVFCAVSFGTGFGLFRALASHPEWGRTVAEIILFFSFSGILLFFFVSTATSAAFTLFLSNDLEFLFSLPVRARTVFAAKLVESLAISFVFLPTLFLPFLIGYGMGWRAPFYFYPAAILILSALLVWGSCFGLVISSVLVRFLPRHRAREIVTAASAVIAVGFALGLQLFAGEIHFRNPSEWEKWNRPENWKPLLVTGEKLLSGPLNFLPSGWAKESLLWASGQGGGGLYFFLLVASAAALFGAVVLSAENIYGRGWLLTPAKAKKKAALPVAAGAVFGEKLFSPFWGMVKKDWQLLRRDFAQLVPVLIMPVVLVAVPFFMSLRAERAAELANILPFFTVGLAGVIGLQNGLRVVPLEGLSMGPLMALPLRKQDFVAAKLFFSGAMTAVELWATAIILGIVFRLGVQAFVTAVCFSTFIAAASTAVGVWIGTVFARWDWSKPDKMVTGGGVFTLIGAMILFGGLWAGLLGAGLVAQQFLPFWAFLILAGIIYGAVSFFLVWLFGVLTVKRLENLEWKFG